MANDYGLKIALEGKNITSTNPDDYAFHSGFNMLKIFKEVHGTLSVTTGVIATKNDAHNLGYKPMILGFFKHPSSSKWYSIPCRTYYYANTPPTWDLLGNIKHIDNNTIQLRLYDGDPAMSVSPTSIEYKYYILVDPRANAWYEAATSDTDSNSGAEDYGFKVSRPGIDVLTAEDKNLIFSTKFNTFKEFRIVKFSATGSIVHGLSYPPTFLSFREDYFNAGEFIRGDNMPIINGGFPIISVNDTYVYCYNELSEDIYVILFIDPLDE